MRKIVLALFVLCLSVAYGHENIQIPATGTDQERMTEMVKLGDQAFARGEDCLAIGYYKVVLKNTQREDVANKIKMVEASWDDETARDKERMNREEAALYAREDREMAENERRNAKYWDLESQWSARYGGGQMASQVPSQQTALLNARSTLLKWFSMRTAVKVWTKKGMFITYQETYILASETHGMVVAYQEATALALER